MEVGLGESVSFRLQTWERWMHVQRTTGARVQSSSSQAESGSGGGVLTEASATPAGQTMGW